MRFVSLALLAALPLGSACVADGGDDGDDDLGTIVDGKADSVLISVSVTIPKQTSAAKPGTKSFTVHATGDFDVALVYTGAQPTKITVTNQDTSKSVSSDLGPNPTLSVSNGGTAAHAYTILLENHSSSALTAKLTATGHGGSVSADLIAAAKANLRRLDKEIDYTHLANYGLSGSLEDQFMSALSAEYEHQQPAQYAARVRALASMAFFALPDVKPPVDGLVTPFHGLDMDQFNAMIAVEDSVFTALVAQNGNSTNGVRPFSVCETNFIVDTYVRPKVAFPGFAPYKTAYTTYASSCAQKDKDDWYNFRGLGGLRPSWDESNLSDRFLRRMAKDCQNPSASWKDECAAWTKDRLGYRQLRNRELAARTVYYAPADEAYIIDPANAMVWLEDRNGDGIGEWLRPGPIKLSTGESGTLQVNATTQFEGNLKFQPATGAAKTITPAQLVAEDAVDSRWNKSYIDDADLGLQKVFSSSTGCTAASLDPSSCALLRRFYSLIDRHENFYQTFSALTPTYYGISSQPSPLVACSITLGASHQWDTAGTPTGGTAGFIFLMRIPFKEILTGNDVSVATIMPGPKTTSIQSLYGGDKLDLSHVWLDVASLSNNQYETEHEISAFGIVPAEEIEGMLVVRKPAAVQ